MAASAELAARGAGATAIAAIPALVAAAATAAATAAALAAPARVCVPRAGVTLPSASASRSAG